MLATKPPSKVETLNSENFRFRSLLAHSGADFSLSIAYTFTTPLADDRAKCVLDHTAF
ncbi:hypothetical protein EVJ58_g8545 [Rhodofomes roseus]|uniref:Uncharacterized protein n=1 Tax=Rhodofomes roseus TaxID=34475 RepID=A0A4Y9Y260_9APHY|nr:hypothetical protein EVJ58_g8545 [Rhodofomes roseus]